MRLGVAVGLLLLPAVTGRWALASARPAVWARFVLVSLVSGLTLLAVTLAHEALPQILTISGLGEVAAMCLRVGGHIVAKLPFGGWLSVGLLGVLIVGGVRGVVNARRRWATMHAEPTVGDHRVLGTNEMVVLDTPTHVAVSVPGSPGQVLVSRSILENLGPDQFDGLIRHEEAHLQLHHSRFLLAGAAVDGALGSVGPIHKGVGALQLSLERWADEVAGDTVDHRTALRSALAGLGDRAQSEGRGYDHDLVDPRLSALAVGSPPPETIWLWGLGAAAIALLFASLTGSMGFHVFGILLSGG